MFPLPFSRYVGSWKAGRRHGYGVRYDAQRRSTHLGMWHSGDRHGFGIVVSNGLYYEGVFLSNRFSGRGTSGAFRTTRPKVTLCLPPLPPSPWNKCGLTAWWPTCIFSSRAPGVLMR